LNQPQNALSAYLPSGNAYTVNANVPGGGANQGPYASLPLPSTYTVAGVNPVANYLYGC